jgi:DNA-binding MarR family transcriptional regulator
MEQKYEALRLGNQLCFPLYLCAKELTRRYQPLLEGIGLTYTQYVVMMYFWEVGSGTARDVSRALLLDPSTLTPVLKKLEQKGYLDRARDPADERSLIITLTDAGAALREKALDIPARMGDCVGLDEEEARTLAGLIGKVLNHLEKEK